MVLGCVCGFFFLLGDVLFNNVCGPDLTSRILCWYNLQQLKILPCNQLQCEEMKQASRSMSLTDLLYSKVVNTRLVCTVVVNNTGVFTKDIAKPYLKYCKNCPFCFKQVDDRFFWNKHMIEDLISIDVSLISNNNMYIMRTIL